MATGIESHEETQSSWLHQDALNYTFYEHRPQDYFSRRLALAQTMLHDGSELFHVLEDRPKLWKELSAMWDENKRGRMEKIAMVFYGDTHDSQASADLTSVWNERIEGIELFMSHFIEYYVDWGGDDQQHKERERYNAAKHGMTLVTVPTSTFMGSSVDEIGLAHLDYDPTTLPRPWKLKIAWTDPEVVALETFSAIMLLEQIWAVGRRQSALLPSGSDAIGDIEWSRERFVALEDMLERRSGQIVRDLDLDDS